MLSLNQEEPCGNHTTHRLPGWVTRTGYRIQMTLYLRAFYGKVAFCTPLSHVVCGWSLPPWYLYDTWKFLSFIASIPSAFTIVTPHKVTLYGMIMGKVLNKITINLKLNPCPKCMIQCRFWPNVWKFMRYFFGERDKLSVLGVKKRKWPAYFSLKIEGSYWIVGFLLLPYYKDSLG